MSEVVEGADREPEGPIEVGVACIATAAFHGVRYVDGRQGWVQPGEEFEVSPDRRQTLVIAGLVERNADDPEGSAGVDSAPLGEARDRTRPLNVKAGGRSPR